jgi:hypothetical protein
MLPVDDTNVVLIFKPAQPNRREGKLDQNPLSDSDDAS